MPDDDILSTPVSFRTIVYACMATSIDNAGEESNRCFDTRLSRWLWCCEDQRAHGLATGPSNGNCLAHSPGSVGVDTSSAVVTREAAEIPVTPTLPSINRQKIAQ